MNKISVLYILCSFPKLDITETLKINHYRAVWASQKNLRKEHGSNLKKKKEKLTCVPKCTIHHKTDYSKITCYHFRVNDSNTFSSDTLLRNSHFAWITQTLIYFQSQQKLPGFLWGSLGLLSCMNSQLSRVLDVFQSKCYSLFINARMAFTQIQAHAAISAFFF